MKLKRSTKLLVEPPSVATGDIAFNLIVFFLVCTSSQPDSGRKQVVPKSESKQEKAEQTENIEVQLKRLAITVNGDPVLPQEFPSKLRTLLKNKTSEHDRIVVVKSDKDVDYQRWIAVTGQIGEAGGIVTLQVEEEKTVVAQ